MNASTTKSETIDEAADRMLNRIAAVLTPKQLGNPKIQKQIGGIIERRLSRRGILVTSFSLKTN